MKKNILLSVCILIAAFVSPLQAQEGVDSTMLKQMLDAYSGREVLTLRFDYFYYDCEDQTQIKSREHGYYCRREELTYLNLPFMESYMTDNVAVGIDHTQKVIMLDSSGQIKEAENPLKLLLASLGKMKLQASTDTLEDSYLIRYEYEYGSAKWTEWRIDRENFRVLESNTRLRGSDGSQPDRCYKVAISEDEEVEEDIRKKIKLMNVIIEQALKKNALPGKFASYKLHIL